MRAERHRQSRQQGWDLRPASLDTLRPLFEQHHAYKGVGGSATAAFGVYEDGRLVAAYTWQPPPFGCAKAVLPDCPGGVLSLSRMVAVPREERRLRFISTPLRIQMAELLDRARWPALVTFSDEGQGHNGHVYLCSGWQKTARTRTTNFENDQGVRTSKYSNGRSDPTRLQPCGHSWKQRWEHHIVPPEQAAAHMHAAGWRHEPIPGKVWASGRPAHRWVNINGGD